MEKYPDKEASGGAIPAFDTLYTNNHLQLLKLLFPYVRSSEKGQLAVYIKLQEFLYTFRVFRDIRSFSESAGEAPAAEMNLGRMMSVLSPYCDEREKALLSQAVQIQNMMLMMKEVNQYMPLFTQMFSAMAEGETKDGNNAAADHPDMMEFVRSMMSEEQQELFSMLMEGGSPHV
jgi:hypothetical protein